MVIVVVITDIERLVRQLSAPQVRGNVMLGGLKASGEDAVVTLSASRSYDMLALEDRRSAAPTVYD